MDDSSDDSLLRAVARSPDITPPAVERDARIGTTIRGKYTLERVLGEGGMAIVYEGRHRNTKRFAVKMLRQRLSASPEARARFVREGYVANRVDHPGAVAILDDDVTDDDSAFIVMELLDGMPLDRVRHPSAAAVVALGVQVCDVLAAAHEKGIVHRDIKPQNLFVTRTGEVKVLDFGIARLREGPSTIDTTQSGGMIGTPAFMPPEQALGKADDVDATSDLWALGATLFALLAGRTVHQGQSAQEVAVQAATQPAPRLMAIAPNVPPAVARVVDKALSFSQSARWSSARVMRDALVHGYRDAFDGTPSTNDVATMFDAVEPIQTRPRRRMSALVPIGLGLFVVAGVASALAITRRRDRETPVAPRTTASEPARSVEVVVASSTPTAPLPSASASVSPIRAPAIVRVKNCDPPYTVEASGKRIPKLECL